MGIVDLEIASLIVQSGNVVETSKEEGVDIFGFSGDNPSWDNMLLPISLIGS